MFQKTIRSKTVILLCVLFFSVLVFSKITAAQVTGQEKNSENESSVTFLPIISNNYDSTLGTPLFGVQMYGNTSDVSIYHPYLIESNASWLRVPISWGSVEPLELEPPVYNWNFVDRTFAAATAEMGQLNIIGTIDGTPERALITYTNPPGEIIAPDKRDEFADFVAAVVERYDGDGSDDAPGSPIILHWEIFNEPDESLVNPKWGNYGAEYADLLSFVYPAVKAANPQAQVLMGGIAYDWFDDVGGKFNRAFLPDILEAGGGDYFDTMNFHSYPAFASNWTANNGPGLLEKAQAVRSVLATHGYTKPLVITEAGWHDNASANLPSTPEIQSRYVVQLFTQSFAAKLDVMIWWMLYDIGGNYPYDTGLVRLENLNETEQVVEKVSLKTYQEVVNELSTAHFVRKLPTSETGSSDLEVYEFSDNTKNMTIYVAWLNPVDTTSSVPLKLPATQAVVIESIPNQTGGELRSYVIQDGDDGKINKEITIAIGGRPLYIEIQQ